MVIDTNSNLDLTPYVVNISLPEFSIEMDTVSIPQSAQIVSLQFPGKLSMSSNIGLTIIDKYDLSIYNKLYKEYFLIGKVFKLIVTITNFGTYNFYDCKITKMPNFSFEQLGASDTQPIQFQFDISYTLFDLAF